MPRASHPLRAPFPRRPQQLDRPVRSGYQMRLAPRVFDRAVSPVAYRANREYYPCSRIRAEEVGEGAVQGVGNFVDRDDAAVEVVRWDFVAVCHVFVGLGHERKGEGKPGRGGGVSYP